MKELHSEGHMEQIDSKIKRLPQETFGMQLGLEVSGQSHGEKQKFHF